MEAILSHEGMPGLKTTLGAVMTLALPAIVEEMMLTMVQYVDTAMVGSLGSEATAAVGMTASTTWLIGGFLSAASVGFSVQVAQHVGAGDAQKARNVVGQAIRFIFIFGLFMAALAVGVSSHLPGWLGAVGGVRQMAVDYFQIYACATLFNFCAMMLGAVIRCSGDTKTPMLLNLGMNLMNMALNFLLIYPSRNIRLLSRSLRVWGAGLGVAGAAWGSLISLACVSGVYFILIYKKDSPVRMRRGDSYRFEKTVLGTAWKIGLPVALERSLICVAHIVITAVIAKIGTAAIAANHLAVTAESLSYMPAYGVATAATTMVGQAIGAKRYDLAKRFSRIIAGLGILIMSAGGALLYFLAPNLIRLFSSDTEVIELGGQVLRIVAFAEPFFAMSIVITGVLRGAGDTLMTFLIGLGTMWGVRITLSLLLAGRMGLAGVWLAMAVELIVRGILFMVRMLRDKWLKIRLFERT